MRKNEGAIRKYYNKWNDKNKVNVIEWLILLLILVTAFMCVYYYDVSCTVDNSILLLKSIYKGEFFHYYDFTIGKTRTVWAPNCEILMYIIFAIWNIPLALVYKFTHIDYIHSMPAVLWTKLLLLICLLIVVYIVYKICLFMGMSIERSRIATFLLLSSINVMIPTLMISQCDIVNLVFIMLGIYMYLQKKTVKFIICFAVAIPLKMFALFIFVPLILIDEKKIIKALLKIVASLSVLIICKAISWQSEAYHYLVGSFSNVMTKQLQEANIQLGSGGFSMFIGGIVAVCIWAYLKEVDKEERNKYIVYIPFLIFGMMFAFFAFFPYWIVLLVPFTIVCIMCNPRYLKLNVLLETLLGITAFLSCALRYYWIYSETTLDSLLISKVTDFNEMNRKYNSVYAVLQHFGIDKYQNAIATVFVVSIITLLILNYPRERDKQCFNQESLEHSVLWVRISSLIIVIALWVGIGLIPEGNTLVNTMDSSESVKAEESVLPEGNSVVQKFDVKKDTKISEIELQFYNEANSHINVSEVVVDIIDLDTKEKILSKRMGTSVIDEKICTVKVNKKLNKGSYELKISGRNDNGEMISPLLTKKLIYQKYPVLINGKEEEQNLYFKIYTE